MEEELPGVQERLRQALSEAGTGRQALKRWARQIDADPELHRALCEQLQALRSVDREPSGGLPAKKLLRWALQREEAARERKNPIAMDEPFVCAHCGSEERAGGARPRDHCSRCLHGLHVDARVPGDRASDCGGLLQPRSLEGSEGRGWILVYRCQRCDAERRCRVHPDDQRAALAALSSQQT